MPGTTKIKITLIESPGRASDTIFSDERTSASNDNKQYHFVSTPKIKRMLVLEECNPVVLVLVLTLVSVGRPSAGAHGSKTSVLLAFLLSICLLQNYEHSIILE
jgi:hypothetical protein